MTNCKSGGLLCFPPLLQKQDSWGADDQLLLPHTPNRFSGTANTFKWVVSEIFGGSGPSRKGSLVRDNHIKAVKSSNRRGFDLDTVCFMPSLLVKKITLAFYAIFPAKNAIDWCPMQEGCRKVHSNFTHMYNIGDRLRKERLTRGYSMEYVAGKLQVNPTTIYRMYAPQNIKYNGENGKH